MKKNKKTNENTSAVGNTDDINKYNIDNNNYEIENIEINKKEKKKKGKVKKVILIIISILLILLIIAGTLFGIKVQKNGGGLQGVLATIVGHDENTLKNLPKIYCLVTGQSQNLTDTIMVCSYDPKTQEASMLSIPRDTFIGTNKKRATSYDKINALYQTSPEKTLKAVNEITGLDIKYYVNIDTSALRKVVDSIGGVYFDVPIDMNYDDGAQNLHIHLNKGYQLLDGDKAEQVVRFRHNTNGTSYPTEYGDNDLGRMKTQRNFLKAVVAKLAKPSSLTKVNDFIGIAEENVTTNVDFSLLKDYAPYAVKFNVENIKTATLPGTPELCNKIWIYNHDKSETKKVVEELFGTNESESNKEESNSISNNSKTSNKEITEKEKIENKKIKIEILNGTSNNEKLNEIKEKLKERGYTIAKTGITTNTSKTMIINRTKVNEDVIEKIQKVLEGLGIESTGTNNSSVDITIVIGRDY